MSLELFQLDYVRPAAAARRARVLLLVAALGFALDAGLHYRSLVVDIGEQELRVGARAARLPRAAPLQPVNEDEYAYARDTLVRLTTPWDELFQALEAAQTERVTLLSIEPDAQQRSVRITAEAKDYLAALSYMANLAQQKGLTDVHLVRHEPQRSALQRPVAFTMSAAWRESR